MPIGPSGVAGFFARARGSSRRSLVCSLRQLSRMCTQNQDEVVRFLESSSTHAGAAVERIETHGSVVFLAGARAWKLKRAVRYDYMDFSTLNRRKAMCEAEVRINRRAAPAIYRGVVPVTRERDGELALGGAGVPVEWLVEMVRFDQDTLLDRLAARRRLDLRLMRPLASAVAAFHRDAPRRHDHGGAHGMALVIDGNAAGWFAPHPVEKIGSGMDVEPPIGRRFRPSVIPGDAAQIVDEVGPQRRMHPHQRRQPRIYLLLHQRGVEMTRIDDDKAGIGHAGGRLHAIRGKARGPLCRLLLPGIGALPSAAKR